MVGKTEKISDAELEILKVLWANKEPMTERQVINALDEESGWHRATIQTLIRRLCEKGALQKVKKDVFYFSAIISETELAKERTEDLVNKVFGGNAKSLVSTMLGNDILSEDDIDDLKNYWRKRKDQNE